jgi:hypothetical protein
MSKKGNLLTEGQVRQFMKLANLEPITPGFITGLAEQDWPGKSVGRPDPGEGKRGDKPATIGPLGDAGTPPGAGDLPPKKQRPPVDPAKKGVEESHGRSPDEGPAGRGKPDQNARSRNENLGLEDEHELENAEDDLEHADDLEVDADEDLGDLGLEDDLAPVDGGREVSVDDFLAALEVALEDVLGDEVEVDQEEDEVEDEEVELPLGDEEGLEVGLDVEEEPALQEMINQITRRVAKRIVKEALQGKK